MLNTRTKKAREELTKAFRTTLATLAVEIEAEEKSHETIITFSTPRLRATIFAEASNNRHGIPPMVHWHNAKGKLKELPNAWKDINPYHRQKATTIRPTWEETLTAVKTGFEAALDNSAFLEEEPIPTP